MNSVNFEDVALPNPVVQTADVNVHVCMNVCVSGCVVRTGSLSVPNAVRPLGKSAAKSASQSD